MSTHDQKREILAVIVKKTEQKFGGPSLAEFANDPPLRKHYAVADAILREFDITAHADDQDCDGTWVECSCHPPQDEPPTVQLMARKGGKTQALITQILAQANERGIRVEVVHPESEPTVTVATKPAIDQVRQVLDYYADEIDTHIWQEIASALDDIPDCESWTAVPHEEHEQGEPSEVEVRAALSAWFQRMIAGGWDDTHEARMRAALRAARAAEQEGQNHG